MKRYRWTVLGLLFLFLTACGSPEAAGTPTPAPEPTPTQRLEPTPMPEPTPSGPLVYTDWSKLKPYEAKMPVYTRRYEDFTDTLIPAGDYGPLVPFAGAALTETWGSWSNDYDLYGLVTLEGEVVVDPVFTSAFYLEEYGDWGLVCSRPDVMLLGKVFYDEEGRPEERFALCAGDGSWCTGFLYEYDWGNYMVVSFAQGIPIMRKDGKLAFVDVDTGKELRALDLAAQMGDADFFVGSFSVDPETGWVAVNPYRWTEEGEYTAVPLLYDPEGNVCGLPPEVRWVGEYGNGLVSAEVDRDEGELTSYRRGYVDATTGEWAIEPVYIKAGGFIDGVASVGNEYGSYLINTAGEVAADVGAHAFFHGGYWYVEGELEEDILAVFDPDLNPVESPLIGCGQYVTYLEDGWISAEVDCEEVLVRGDEVVRFPGVEEFPYRLGTPIAVHGDRVLLTAAVPSGDPEQADLTWVSVTDLEGNIIAQWELYGGASFVTDPVTGESCLEAYGYTEDGYWSDFYDTDGKLMFAGRKNTFTSLLGGLICVSEDDCTTLTGLDGNVIFRWPIHSAVD